MLAIQPKPIRATMNTGRPGMPNTNGWPSMGEMPNNMGGTDLRSFLLSLLNGMGGGMFKGIGSTLLGIGSTLLTNKLNQQWAKEQQEAQWNKEQQFSDQAYRRQLELIEKYQTPAAMKRMLKEAGLSPGLMYSNSAGSVGTGSVNKGNAGMGNVPMMANPLSMMAETLQLSKLKAEMDNIKADTEKKLAEAENTDKSSENLDIINRNLQNQIDTELQNIQSETDKNKATEILTQSQNYAQELENMFREETLWTEVEGKIVETENLKKLGEKMAEEIRKIGAEINNLNVDSKLKHSLMQKAVSDMLLANQQILTMAFERDAARKLRPVELETAKTQLKQALEQAYSMELDNIKKEELIPYTKFDYWNGVATGWLNTGVGAVQSIMYGKGAIAAGKGYHNKHYRPTQHTKRQDRKVRLDQRQYKYPKLSIGPIRKN